MSTSAGPPGSASAAPGEGRGRPTLEQVAARAGVSRATVSRVANKVASVDPRLVERVTLAIDDLHYVPNQAARSLMTRRTDTVVLIAAESAPRVFSDPFFAAIARGVSEELSRAGMHLVLSMAHGGEDVDRVEAFVQAGHVDGVLVISEHHSLDAVRRLAAAGVPVVVGGRPFAPESCAGYVDHDNRRGGALAAERLLAIGRTRIGIIAGPSDMSAAVDRLAGFRMALGARFDPDLVESGDFTSSSGAAAVTALLKRRPDVDGLFVASDMMALGGLSRLQAAGRRVPEDVAVVGFDDSEVAAVAVPALTTVRQRTIDQGRLMAQLLVHRLGRAMPAMMPELARDPGATGIVLDVALVVRATA